MPQKPSFLLFRLSLTATAVILTGLFLTIPRHNLLAQDTNTATPTAVLIITASQPELNPPLGGSNYPDGWLSITGKSAYTIYAAPNVDPETAATFAGVWRPDVPRAGLYQVSVYLGIGELGEYRTLNPDTLAPDVELTRSAFYQISHAEGVSNQSLDQAGRDSGWVDLGVYPFNEGTDGVITLTNQTDEANGTAVVTFSALQLTPVTQPSPTTEPAATVTPTPAPPTPTDTPAPTATATAVPPTATSAPALDLLDFGQAQISAAATSEAQQEEGLPPREEADIPISIDGKPVGRMVISYPSELRDTEADDIRAAIIVTESFTNTLTVTLEDATANQELGTLPIRREFYLTLDAASFTFDDLLKTQKLTVRQNESIGAVWNVQPAAGSSGRQAFNVKVILSFSNGIPEISGNPPTLYINVPQDSEPIEPTPTSTPASTVGRIFNNLIDNTAVLVGACLSFIVGILGVAIAYMNYRKNQGGAPPADAPVVLGGKRQVQLHRWLDDYFNEQELRSLCLAMGVDYDDLRFSGQSNKARELVGWCARNGRLDELEQQIREQRPNLPPHEDI